MERSLPTTGRRQAALPAALVAGAGLVHLAHSVSHGDEPILFWFFVVAAAVQIGIAAALLSNLRFAPWAVLLFNGGLVGLYAATRFAPPPGIAAEPVEALGLSAKALEVGSMVLVARMLASAARRAGPGKSRESRLREGGRGVSRRGFLAGSLGAAGAATGGLFARAAGARAGHRTPAGDLGVHLTHFGNVAVGEVDTSRFDPTAYLEEFDYGKISTLPDGRTLREFFITAVDVDIEVAPGVTFPAWAYNRRVPGPTLRATEGDLVRVHFTNAGSHPHTIHFHGFHRAAMDGVFEQVGRGRSFTYEFIAAPFGLHLYHCHTPPLKRHIHKGLYGTFIVDPPGGRPPANEMVMMMNGFDTNFDGENEVYAVNTVAHYYMRHPIRLRRDELVRIYLVNITEFDLINSFHSHATFFHEYRTGTKLTPDNFTDTVMLGQGERSILELRYREPGLYMFHAHVSEFAELGWSGMFEVAP